MELQPKCPACERLLLSRRHRQCQYCGTELPTHLLATKDEIDTENREWEQIQEARRLKEKVQDEVARELGASAGY